MVAKGLPVLRASFCSSWSCSIDLADLAMVKNAGSTEPVGSSLDPMSRCVGSAGLTQAVGFQGFAGKGAIEGLTADLLHNQRLHSLLEMRRAHH